MIGAIVAFLVGGPAEAQPVGGLELAAAAGFAAGAVPGGGFQARFSFQSQRFSLGPEFLGLWSSRRRTRLLGLSARYQLGRDGGVRPHFAVGAGFYTRDRLLSFPFGPPGPSPMVIEDWVGTSSRSSSVGGGLTLGGPGGTLRVIVEGRYHNVVARGDPTLRGRGLWTSTAGVRIRW